MIFPNAPKNPQLLTKIDENDKKISLPIKPILKAANKVINNRT